MGGNLRHSTIANFRILADSRPGQPGTSKFYVTSISVSPIFKSNLHCGETFMRVVQVLAEVSEKDREQSNHLTVGIQVVLYEIHS